MKTRQRFRRPHRIKRKKLIFRSRFFWLGMLIILILFPISYFLFFSKTFQIKNIIITGEEKVSEENIKALIPKENIFLINITEIKKDILNNFPQIAEVKITRGFPDILNIVVKERVAVGVWCGEENCFLMDEEGIIFDQAPSKIDLIKIFGERGLLTKEKISQILEIQRELKENLEISVSEAEIISDRRINFKTIEDWEIYFNLKKDLDLQVTELGLVLEKRIPPAKRKDLKYIDLRFTRIYYKYR